MRVWVTALSRALRLLIGLAVGAVLAGCVIQSKELLIDPAEGVAALPLKVWLTSYDKSEAGVAKSKDAPVELTFKDTLYVSNDNSFQVRFVPLVPPDTYLADITGAEEGHVYAVGRYRNNVLVLNAMLSEPDLEGVLAAERSGAGADALKDVTVSQDALIVTERKALVYLLRMNLEGRLTMSPFVLYVSEFADAQAPETLVPDGDFWKAPE